MRGDLGLIPCWEDLLEKGHALTCVLPETTMAIPWGWKELDV